jgi:hypothetical protein
MLKSIQMKWLPIITNEILFLTDAKHSEYIYIIEKVKNLQFPSLEVSTMISSPKLNFNCKIFAPHSVCLEIRHTQRVSRTIHFFFIIFFV